MVFDSEKVPAVKRGLLEVLATAATQSKAGQSMYLMGVAREQLGQERHPLTVLLFRAVVARTNFQVFRTKVWSALTAGPPHAPSFDLPSARWKGERT
jgi:hypothetical protein